MIKVIKEGYVPKVITPLYRITCDKCHTVIECEEPDTKFKMVGHGEGALYLNCPVCGKEIDNFMNPNWIISNLKEIVAEEKKARRMKNA